MLTEETGADAVVLTQPQPRLWRITAASERVVLQAELDRDMLLESLVSIDGRPPVAMSYAPDIADAFYAPDAVLAGRRPMPVGVAIWTAPDLVRRDSRPIRAFACSDDVIGQLGHPLTVNVGRIGRRWTLGADVGDVVLRMNWCPGARGSWMRPARRHLEILVDGKDVTPQVRSQGGAVGVLASALNAAGQVGGSSRAATTNSTQVRGSVVRRE